MATKAQVEANRENATHSSGPASEAGKQTSSRNAIRHGLTGHAFVLLDWERADDYDELRDALTSEHRPTTPTEQILIEKMAQHHWLAQRAQFLQTFEMKEDTFHQPEVQKIVAGYLRYQVHHDRLFQRALKDLLTLRAEKRKAEIGRARQSGSVLGVQDGICQASEPALPGDFGFVSQKAGEAKEARAAAQEIRRAAGETRKTEQHKLKLSILEAKLKRELTHVEAPTATTYANERTDKMAA